MSKIIEAAEVVDRYALAFYRAIDPALATVHAEREQALAAGLTPHAASKLYDINFGDIQEVVYDWLTNCPENVNRVAERARMLPGLLDDDARKTDFEANFDTYATAVAQRMFSGNYILGSFSLNEGNPPLKLLHVLLAVFNNSHALNMREKLLVPASLAMLVQECSPKLEEWSSAAQFGRAQGLDPLAIFRANGLPVLAPGVHASEVYYAAEGQAGPQVWYPVDLWSNIA